MTLGTLLERLHSLRPHDVPEGELRARLAYLEQQLHEEVMAPRVDAPSYTAIGSDTPLTHSLLLPDPASELYLLYLMAQIDLARADAERYRMDMAVFAAAYQQFADGYARAHLPAGRTEVRA